MHARLARTFPVLLATLLATAAAATPADQNLLENPGFEKGKKEPSGWSTHIPVQVATSKPRFTVTAHEPKEGKRSASVRADYRGGFTGYLQSLRMPPKARSIHVEGQVRLDRVTYDGAAKLVVSFLGPKLPGGRVRVESRRLSGVADWTRLSIDASIPDGTKTIEVRCGVEGPCVASFDEVIATASKEESLLAVFGSVQSDYAVRVPANAREELAAPFVRVPLPLADATQRPVAFRVNTRPEGKAVSLSLFRSGVNRMLEVRFEPMVPGDEVKLRLDTLVMVDATERELPSLLRMPRLGQMKGEIPRYLAAAPGIDPGHSGIVTALSDLKGNDLTSVLQSVRDFVQAHVKVRVPDENDIEPVYDDSVAGCFTTGESGSLGFANMTAAVLRALGIPARLMLGTIRDSETDEHYFVDVWSAQLGWTRMDPMTGEWPMERAVAVIHRLVEPEDPRYDGHTPFDPKVSTPGLILEVRPDRLGRARIYRFAKPVALTEGGLLELRRRVAASYDDLAGDPMAGSIWQPIAGTVDNADAIDGAAVSHVEIQRWLELPRLVGQ